MLGATLPLVALIALFGAFTYIVLRFEGLALFAPKRTGGLTNSGAAFCRDQCRLVDGRCPMTGSHEPALNCPLWKFIEADVPTTV